MLIIKVNDTAVYNALDNLHARTRDMAPAMKDIGECLLDGTKRRFVRGADWNGTAWAPNAPATLARKKSGWVC